MPALEAADTIGPCGFRRYARLYLLGGPGNKAKAAVLGAIVLVMAMPVWVRAEETSVMYLSSLGKDDPVKWEFYCTGGRNPPSAEQWTTIGIPSNWELQGFGTYNYRTERNKADEQGKYRRDFTIPDGWRDKRVFVVFEGVMTDTEVWVNGQSAGPRHQGGFCRFKYDITSLIKRGRTYWK